MHNTLEKFIQEHRNEMDVFAPSPSVWQGISTQVQHPTFLKSHASWLKYFGFSASVIAVLVYLKINSSPADPENKKEQTAPVAVHENKVQNISPAENKIIPENNLAKEKTVSQKISSPEVKTEPTEKIDSVKTENNNQPNNTSMKTSSLAKALVFTALALDTTGDAMAQNDSYGSSHKESKKEHKKECKKEDGFTQQRQVSSFSELNISSVGDVFISQGDKESVSITGDSSAQEHIEVVNEGNALVIRPKNERKNFPGEITINVTIKNISKLKISGIGKVKTETPLNLEELECKISSMGNLSLELNCQKFAANISSIGNCKLKGKAETADIALSGMGNFRALDFEVGKLNARMSGMGNAEVYATEEITVNASGMGNLDYKGNPKLENIKTSGMGNVKKI